MFLLKIKKWVYSRFFVKALPEGLFKYTSKSRAFWRSVKAMAVLTRQGLYFDVWGFCPWLWDFRRDSKSGMPSRSFDKSQLIMPAFATGFGAAAFASLIRFKAKAGRGGGI